MGHTSFRERFRRLYNLVRRKHDTVQQVISSVPLNVSFQRNLIGRNLDDWQELVYLTSNVQIIDSPDRCIWSLHKSGQFSVHSMYAALMDEISLPINKPLWKLKIPLKVKVFIWLLHRGVILTKDNLAKRNWNGSKQCCYCSAEETIAHLFFDCHLARLVWRIIHTTFGIHRPRSITHMFGSWLFGTKGKHKNMLYTGVNALCWVFWLCRNDIVFHYVKKQTGLQILFRATHLIRTWAILHKEEDRDTIVAVCRALESTAIEIFARHGWQFRNSLCF